MAKPLNELPPPASARKSPQANEICRVWVVDGGLHVSMQKAFDDPAVWGLALVDIARHAARMYAAESKTSFEEGLARIGEMWRAELARPTDVGTTSTQ